MVPTYASPAAGPCHHRERDAGAKPERRLLELLGWGDIPCIELTAKDRE